MLTVETEREMDGRMTYGVSREDAIARVEALRCGFWPIGWNMAKMCRNWACSFPRHDRMTFYEGGSGLSGAPAPRLDR
jgi:hypothetical protein